MKGKKIYGHKLHGSTEFHGFSQALAGTLTNMATRKGLSVVRQGLQVSKDAKLKPGLSKSGDEARHRALVLYKAWYKSIPYIGWFEIMV